LVVEEGPPAQSRLTTIGSSLAQVKVMVFAAWLIVTVASTAAVPSLIV
jgi:hypothetical protein